MIYLFLYCFVLLFGIFFSNKCFTFNTAQSKSISYSTYVEPKGPNAFLVLTGIMFVLLAAFRNSSVGADTESYIRLFEQFSQGAHVKDLQSVVNTVELGYLYLVQFIGNISDKPYIFLGIQAVIIYYGVLKFVKRNSTDKVMSVMLFTALYYTSTFNIMRQYLAVSIALISFSFLQDKKYIRAVIFFIIAISVHITVLVMIPIILIQRIPNKKKIIVWYEIIVLVLVFVLPRTSLVNSILRLFGYQRYINSYHMKAADSSGIMGYVFILILALAIFVAIKFKNELDDDYYGTLMISTIGIGTSLLASSNEMFVRIGIGYNMYVVLIFPMIIKMLFGQNKNYQIISFGVYIMLFIATFISSAGYTYSLNI